jgi:hypothetical protein
MHQILFLPDIQLIQKPDTGYPAGYLVRARYRISSQILGLATIFLVKYQINLLKNSFNNYRFVQTLNKA